MLMKWQLLAPVRSWTALVLLLTLLVPHVSSAAVERSVATGQRPSGRFSLTPSRFEGSITGGEPLVIPIQLYNGTASDVSVALTPVDIGAAEDPESFIQVVDKAQFSATAWLQPEIDKLDMKSLETVEFDVIVDPPDTPPAGTSFAGIEFSVASTTGSAGETEARKSNLGFKISGLMQIFLTGPGAVNHDVRIKSAEVADTFIFRGNRFVSYEITYENRGNVNDHVSGDIAVTSMFGNQIESINLKKAIILRGSERKFRVIWPDTPAFGRFTAVARVDGDEQRVSRRFPVVVILPPWWWFVILFVVIACPTAYMIYRRQTEWKRYLDEDDAWDEDDEWDTEPI